MTRSKEQVSAPLPAVVFATPDADNRAMSAARDQNVNDIVPHTFPETGQPVRTVTIDGEPHFVASDICAVLGIANVGNALARLSGDDIRSTDVIDSIGRSQETKAVTESGLYDLILDSRKPQARYFRRWVTADVIPSIRRTGSYSVATAPALPDITTPAGVLAMAEQFALTARQLVDADRRIAELEPKAVAHDTYLSAQSGERLVKHFNHQPGLFAIGEIA